jgi:thioredoxin-dependent peroxiredoxin
VRGARVGEGNRLTNGFEEDDMLAEGTTAPDFTLTDDSGASVTLSDLRGKWVLVWFYPMADTAGCTIEGCGLRDQFPDYSAADCEILGVSFDDVDAIMAFKEKHGFPYRLLSDHDEQVGVAYETRDPGTEKVSFSKRISYLVDPEGVIAKSYEVGDVKTHPADVLTDLRDLQAA